MGRGNIYRERERDFFSSKLCFSSQPKGKGSQNQTITEGSLQSTEIRSWVCRKVQSRKLLPGSQQARGPQRCSSSTLTGHTRALCIGHFDFLLNFNHLPFPRRAQNSKTPLRHTQVMGPLTPQPLLAPAQTSPPRETLHPVPYTRS